MELKGKYEGYIWMSNENRPRVFDGNEEISIELDNTKNPFIIEGQLYNDVTKDSVSIRYADGNFIVSRCNVAQLDCEKSERTYYGNRGNLADKKLKFLQLWEEETDEKCENMKVLHPKALVFVGFKK